MMNIETWPTVQTWHGWWENEQVFLSIIDEHSLWAYEYVLTRRWTCINGHIGREGWVEVDQHRLRNRIEEKVNKEDWEECCSSVDESDE